MQRPRRGTVENAKAMVQEYMRAKKLRQNDEFPSLQTLASSAGVSYVTMGKALKALKEQGVVSGVPGHPFRVGTLHKVLPRPAEVSTLLKSTLPVQSTAWRRTREKIERDIIEGVIAPGAAFPSFKELQNRYGVSYATIRKALGASVTAGIIERRGSGFTVPSFCSPSRFSRIIWLTHSYDLFSMYLGQHDEEIYRTLERECTRAQIRLDVFLVCFEYLAPPRETLLEPRPWRHFLRECRTGRTYAIDEINRLGDPSILGYILIAPGKYDAFEEKALPILAGMNVPVAILAQSANWGLPKKLARSRFLRLFTIAASSKPARRVARFLLSKKHRNIAFISPYHHYIWSQRRLEGLMSIYSEGVSAGVVSAFVQEGKDDSPKQVLTHLDGLMKQALRDRERSGTTAWVMVNDQTATIALEFLARKGVNVPGELSVISFDDTIDSLRLNLTSYNFNAAGTAMALLGYILNRKPFASIGLHDILEIEGFIADRLTTDLRVSILTQGKNAG